MTVEWKTCQACRKKPIAKKVVSQPGCPRFLLCEGCAERLKNHTLRPLEFFQLAAWHGHPHDIHDDFYDYETGEAIQPEGRVRQDPALRMPKANECESVPAMVDFGFATGSWPGEFQSRRLDTASMLEEIDRRVAYNPLQLVHVQLMVEAMGGAAAEWLKQRWEPADAGQKSALAALLAKALPSREASELILPWVDEMDPEEKWVSGWRVVVALGSDFSFPWLSAQLRLPIPESAANVAVAGGMQWPAPELEKAARKGGALRLFALDYLFAESANRGAPAPTGKRLAAAKNLLAALAGETDAGVARRVEAAAAWLDGREAPSIQSVQRQWDKGIDALRQGEIQRAMELTDVYLEAVARNARRSECFEEESRPVANPDFVRLARATLLVTAGEVDLAERDLRALPEPTATRDHWLAWTEALRFEREGKYADALASADRAVRLMPKRNAPAPAWQKSTRKRIADLAAKQSRWPSTSLRRAAL